MKIKTPFFTIEIESLFFIILLITIFSSNFRIYILNYFICYLFILFHELSHMFVASILGKEIDNFKFSISGVNISFKRNDIFDFSNNKIIKNIIIYIAGPLSNILLSIIFKNNILVYQVNMFLAIINLLPIFPLDGYNILLNVFKLFNNIEKDKCYLITEYIGNIFFFVLLIISLYQILYFKNPSIIIFLIYVFLLRQNQKQEKMYEKALYKMYY